MDAIGYVAILFFGAFVVWAFFLGKEKDAIEEIKKELPTPEELKKLKKAELATLAEEHGIMVDPKSTKAVIIKEIDSFR